MSDMFSTPDSHAFDHSELESINAEAGPSNGSAVKALSIEEAFEVQETVNVILEGGYKTVSTSTANLLVALNKVDLVW